MIVFFSEFIVFFMTTIHRFSKWRRILRKDPFCAIPDVGPEYLFRYGKAPRVNSRRVGSKFAHELLPNFSNLLVVFRSGHLVFKISLFYLANMENSTFAGEVDFYTNTFQSCIYTPMLQKYKYRYKYSNITCFVIFNQYTTVQ